MSSRPGPADPLTIGPGDVIKLGREDVWSWRTDLTLKVAHAPKLAGLPGLEWVSLIGREQVGPGWGDPVMVTVRMSALRTSGAVVERAAAAA